MIRPHRHLPFGTWALAGVVVVGLLIGIVMLVTDNSPASVGGTWEQDSRGVWVARGTPMEKPEAVRQQEFLIREAQLAYDVLNNQGQDLTAGPCLGTIFQDWVADIVHTPRTAADDEAANQCAAFQSGEVRHVIELSLQGDVVRVQ